MFYRSLKILIFIVCFSAAGWFCRKQTDGFTVLKISSDLPYRTLWETPCLAESEEMVRNIFEQPFSYLARGDQCYVFVSQDQKYVLKFFRQNHMRPPAWANVLPSFMREDLFRFKGKKLFDDFKSYTIAFKELKEETGLVFLHLNKTDNLGSTVTLIDKIGIAHRIPLDSMEFLLQKRAELLYPTLEECIKKKEIEAAKTTLSELVCLLMKTRYEKGIYDTDPDLNTNFGCIGTTPVQIDIGRFKRAKTRKDQEQCREEIAKITDNLHQWLQGRSQELDDHLLKTIEQLGKEGL